MLTLQEAYQPIGSVEQPNGVKEGVKTSLVVGAGASRFWELHFKIRENARLGSEKHFP